MKYLLILALSLSACSIQAKPDLETQSTIRQHTVILGAIANYINDLQAKGILPKPENKEK